MVLSKGTTTTSEGNKSEGMSTRQGGRVGIGSRSPLKPLTPSSPATAPAATGKPAKTEAVKLADIQKIIDKLDGVDQRIEFSTQHLTDKIEDSSERVNKVEDDCAQVKVTTKGLKTQLSIHSTRISEVEDKIEKLERERRRTTLIIDGVTEVEPEDLTKTVESIFQDIVVSYTTKACINIYRRGRVTGLTAGRKQEELRPRPIVIVFLRQTEKAELFRNLKNLKGIERWSKVFFNDDWTEQQAVEQRDLRALAAYANSKGREATVRAGVLWFEGRKLRYEDLFKLPNDISLMKAKTLQILDGEGIVFQSPHSPLSNLYPCNLNYRERQFLSAEGAYQYSRALVSGNERVAELIILERRPYRVKKLAFEVKPNQEWEDIAESVMREILMVKFNSNRFCKQFLLGTGKAKLFEGTGDRRWGCGIPISKADQISFRNPGKNILGHMLESVREEIRPK